LKALEPPAVLAADISGIGGFFYLTDTGSDKTRDTCRLHEVSMA
jgi:hypothetical protein